MTDAVVPMGIRLKAAREQRGLSAQKAADELHLDAWVIDALEAEDYARIGPAVYAKGHFKRYAALLGLPAAEVAAGLAAKLPPQPGAAAPAARVTPFGSLRQSRDTTGTLSTAQIFVGTAALILAALVVWWKPWHHRGGGTRSGVVEASGAAVASSGTSVAGDAAVASATSAPATDAPLDAPGAPASPSSSALPPAAALRPAAGAAAAGVTLSSAMPNSAAANTGQAADTPAGAGHARLRLSFSANSHVDVRDATGRLVYSGNGLANSVKSFAGAAPLRVFLDSGSGVQLEINGHVVAIGPQFFAGDVARFEAGADGVLRRDTHNDLPRAVQSRDTRPPG